MAALLRGRPSTIVSWRAILAASGLFDKPWLGEVGIVNVAQNYYHAEPLVLLALWFAQCVVCTRDSHFPPQVSTHV